MREFLSSCKFFLRFRQTDKEIETLLIFFLNEAFSHHPCMLIVLTSESRCVLFSSGWDSEHWSFSQQGESFFKMVGNGSFEKVFSERISFSVDFGQVMKKKLVPASRRHLTSWA